MFTFLIFSEVYYHLCNNRCGGVNGRLNCQTESKISAADKMGGGKLNPTMKKIFFRKYYGILQRNFFFLIFFFYESANGRPVKKKPKGSVMYMLAWIWVFITLLIRRSFTFIYINFFKHANDSQIIHTKGKSYIINKNLWPCNKKPSNEENRYIAIWANGSCG